MPQPCWRYYALLPDQTIEAQVHRAGKSTKAGTFSRRYPSTPKPHNTLIYWCDGALHKNLAAGGVVRWTWNESRVIKETRTATSPGDAVESKELALKSALQ